MTVGARQFNLSGSASSADYRRCARHLRHVHRGDATRLQQSLRRLSNDMDARHEARAPAPAPSPLGLILEREIEAALDGPVLRYSNRQWLLKRAGQLGIGRFEASLLIATVQHRAHQRIAEAPRPPRPIGVGTALAAALLVEAALLAGAWLAFS